jgi:hypothetical protein
MAYGDRQLSNQRQAVRRDPGVQRIELGLGYIAAGRKAIFIPPMCINISLVIYHTRKNTTGACSNDFTTHI